MKVMVRKILCWWRHDWAFVGGEWVIPEKYATTKRSCQRCGLYHEIGQDHVNGIRFLDKKEMRSIIPPKYPMPTTNEEKK